MGELGMDNREKWGDAWMEINWSESKTLVDEVFTGTHERSFDTGGGAMGADVSQ